MKNLFLKFSILHSAFLILLVASCGRKPAEPVEAGPPPAVSNFTLKNLASEFPGEIKTAEYAGKVQLVLFLRTDDAGCRGSLGDWNGLQKEFAARGFTLVGAGTEVVEIRASARPGRRRSPPPSSGCGP